MKKIAIIGANEFQNKLVLKARDMGLETHVFAWSEGAVAKDASDYFYPISIMDKEKILDIVHSIEVDGICSIASDLAMPTVNYVAEKLGHICNSQECTILTTNKYEMRKKLNESGLPIPVFQLIKEEQDIDFRRMTFPLIVKPIDRSCSRGIYKVMNMYEVRDAIRNAIEASFTDDVLIEEYVDGKEFSIEALSQKGQHKILQITEKFTSGAPHFIESAHLSPGRVEKDIQQRIFEIIEKALCVLGIENGASHSEIKVSAAGDIKIIEVAARMGGDFIGSDMVQISTGFDFVRSVINVAIREQVDSCQTASGKYALVKFVFDLGDIKRLNQVEREYPTAVKEYHLDSKMKQVTDSSSRNGYCILELKNEEQLKNVIDILEMDIKY